MAKQARKHSAEATPLNSWNFPLEKNNLIFLGISIGVLIIGYLLMATGISDAPAVPDGKWNNFIAVDVAPVVLMLAYCVLIPYGLVKIFKKSESKVETN